MKSVKIAWAAHAVRMSDENVDTVLVGRPEGEKSTLETQA
jgi:hypothetical protein